MAVSFKYWDDCVEPADVEAMWLDPDVSHEWIDAGETKGKKVLLSRDPDGQPFLTQTELRAVAEIVVSRHFISEINPDMIRALAEIASDRQPLATRYNKKTKETGVGLMQITQATAERMVSEMGYQEYEIAGNTAMLHRPFVNVYLGAAYLKWLSAYDGQDRDEEFIVRAYKGIKKAKKAYHKSTEEYWNRYISVKQSMPSRRNSQQSDPYGALKLKSTDAGDKLIYWDSIVSPEDMEDLWMNPVVQKEWNKSGERKGRVRFPQHAGKKRPYLSCIELKAVAEIIISRHFAAKHMDSAIVCALAEMTSMRFINGVSARSGIMGIDYPTAVWLHRDGYNAYQAKSEQDLSNPFLSMYFGAAYLVWLSNYEGRERAPEFIAQAFIEGPENVKDEETDQFLLKFQEALALYRDPKTVRNSCSIL